MPVLDQAFANTLGSLTQFGQLGLGRQELALRERLGMRGLGLDERRLRLAEMLAPEQLAAMEVANERAGFDLYAAMQEQPITLARAKAQVKQFETTAKLLDGLLGEGEDMASSLQKETQKFTQAVTQGAGAIWNKLKGLKPAVAAQPTSLADLVVAAEPAAAPVAAQAAAAAGTKLGGLAGLGVASYEALAPKAAGLARSVAGDVGTVLEGAARGIASPFVGTGMAGLDEFIQNAAFSTPSPMRAGEDALEFVKGFFDGTPEREMAAWRADRASMRAKANRAELLRLLREVGVTDVATDPLLRAAGMRAAMSPTWAERWPYMADEPFAPIMVR